MGLPVIAGYGFTRVGEHWDRGLKELSLEAIEKVFDGLPSLEIDAVYVGTALSGFYELQLSLASHVADLIARFDVSVSNFEAGAASAAQAFYNAALGIYSGMYRAVLVGGVEKMSDELPAPNYRGVSLVEDSFLVDYSGLTEIGLHALLAKMYLSEYGLEEPLYSYLPVYEHENASKAGHAQFRNRITYDMVRSASPVSDPLTIFDVTAPGDGAAYVLLMDKEYADSLGLEYVRLLGMGAAGQPANLFDRASPLFFSATSRAVEKALERAGLEMEDICLLEMYNPSSISGALILESIGLADKGGAGPLLEKGYFSLNGELPVNTFGGAKARGDPKGATTAYQLAEATMQLLGRAGENQVDGAEHVLVHSMVGLDISSYAFVLGV